VHVAVNRVGVVSDAGVGDVWYTLVAVSTCLPRALLLGLREKHCGCAHSFCDILLNTTAEGPVQHRSAPTGPHAVDDSFKGAYLLQLVYTHCWPLGSTAVAVGCQLYDACLCGDCCGQIHPATLCY
jgi:hypothetical protein